MNDVLKITDYFVNNIVYYYYGLQYTGSYSKNRDVVGKRFRIARDPLVNLFTKEHEKEKDDPNARIIAQVWPGEFCYEVTKRERVESIISAEFPFTAEGLEQARCWINRKLEE